MTTVEPIDELLLQKKLECQEKLNKTNESFEPGKQFMVFYSRRDSSVKYNYVRNFRQQTAQTRSTSENKKHKQKMAENRFPQINLPLVSSMLHDIKVLVYVLIVLTHISCKTNRFHRRWTEGMENIQIVGEQTKKNITFCGRENLFNFSCS